MMFRAILAASAMFGMVGTAMAATGTGTSTTKVASPITVTQVTELSFGKFASDGTGNTIVDMATDGSVTCMGASLCGANSPAAGSFDVVGTPNQIVGLSSPGNFFLTSGGNSVEIGNGVLSGAGVTILGYFSSSAVLSSTGTLNFKYTGSLWMTAGTPEGDFSGSYLVNVNYQ